MPFPYPPLSLIATLARPGTKYEREGKTLSPEAESAIEALWHAPSPVKLVEFHALLARHARQLARSAVEKGWSLKPMDSIHLATGMIYNVDAVETYDERLFKFADLIGRKIRYPFIEQAPLDFRGGGTGDPPREGK